MNFGERIQKILDEKQLTQADLCRLTGLKSGHIAQYMTQPDRDPRLSTVIKIADALDVSVDYLAGRTERNVIAYTDAETSALVEGFSALNKRGREAIREQVKFQLTQNPKKEYAEDNPSELVVA